MKNYANEIIECDGCRSCAYANHEFSLPCGIAYENERFVLSQDWELPIPAFFIVTPKKHIEKFEELNKEEKNEMFEIVDKTIRILRNNNICDRFNVVFEEKENKHFHIWIMPRHKWMSDLVGRIIENISQIFEYAINNMRTIENYNKIKEITNLVKKEFENNSKN